MAANVEGSKVARSDLILALVRAATAGDQRLLFAATQAIIAEARSRQHHALADRMQSALDGPREVQELALRIDADVALFDRSIPNIHRKDLIFPPAIWRDFDKLVEENHRRDLLRSYGLEPRHRVLLSGAPGTGKTTLASLLASELALPLLRINYAMLFGSLLGETTQRLGAVLDEASNRECVLLLDEFDAIGKARDDQFDTGEVKRTLNYLLVRLEDLPSHVVVVAATNRPEALDRALWRRFDLALTLPNVTPATLTAWIAHAKERSIAEFGLSDANLRALLRGLSFAELEAFFQDLQREYVLSLPGASMKSILQRRVRDHTVHKQSRRVKR